MKIKFSRKFPILEFHPILVKGFTGTISIFLSFRPLAQEMSFKVVFLLLALVAILLSGAEPFLQIL